MTNQYDPRSLPIVNAVEVVDIRRLDANRVSQYMQISHDQPCVRLEGAQATAISNAWRALKTGEAARCHVPSIGFRFIMADETYLEASVCWRCSNLFGVENETEIFYAFDSECESAKELYSIAREAIGLD